MDRTLRFEARGVFRATPEALWPLVSDTARMNQVIGNPPVEYTVTPLDGGRSSLEGRMRLFGLPLASYVEHPFRWEAPHRFVVLRDFQGGPFQRVRAGAELSPVDGGTEVLIYGEFLPRNALGRVLARVVGRSSVRKTIAQCRIFERYLLGDVDDPFPQLRRKRPLPARARGVVEQLVQAGQSPEAAELLRRHLAEAADRDVVKMRPFELADRWGLDRRETLALCLHATRAGLLEMSWDVLCPNCRIAKAEHASLRELALAAHCDTCNIVFDATFDRSIEVRFSVAPALRQVDAHEFCVGGPQNTPHVLAQTSLGPGEAGRLDTSLGPGSYRLRTRPARGRAVLEAVAGAGAARANGAAPATLTITPEAIEPVVASIPAGPFDLEVRNATDGEQLVLLEAGLWPETAATAALASTMPELRALFSSEVPPPGVRLGIENLALIAVDLGRSGGTEAGRETAQDDADLALIRWAVEANRGAVVRAAEGVLLASHAIGADALAAALQIGRQLRDATVSGEGDRGRPIAIGLHQGPCVALGLDGRLDYAGTSVDVAAGLARIGRPGEIVASLAVCHSEGVEPLRRAPGVVLAEDLVALPDVGGPVPVYRVRLFDVDASLPVASVPPETSGNGTVVGHRLARAHGALVFDYQPGSYAAERIDAVAAGYAEALDRILAFLRVDVARLPPITLRLAELPPGEEAESLDARRAGPETTVVMGAETPGPRPELVLAPLVLEALLGPGDPLARFWADGLAGVLAAEGGSPEHAEAPDRIRKLQEEGQLQPLADQIQQRAARHSPVATLVATAFSRYLIERQGRERFGRLLRAAWAGRQEAFRRVYGRPLQTAEGEWLRQLETDRRESKRSVVAALRDLRPYFKTYWVQLGSIVLTMLLGLAFDVFTPLALRFLIDNILGGQPVSFALPGLAQAGERITPDQQMPALGMLLAAMVVMFLLNAFARIRQSYLLATIGEGVNLDLRRRFFQHLQRLPVSYHARTSTTDLSQRFFTDIAQVPAALSVWLGLVNSGLSMVLFASTLLSLNLWLALIAIAGLPFFVLVSRRGRVAIRHLSRERGRRASEIQQALFENLNGQRFLRLLNARPYALRRFDERLEIHRGLNIRTTLLSQAFSRATTLITNGAQVAILIGGGLIVIVSAGQALSPGGLMAFYVLLLRLYLPAASFAGGFQTLEQAADAMGRVRKILDLPEEAEPDDAETIGPLREALVLRDVQLVQPNGKAQLNGLTAEIPAGARVAFVGSVGGGKAGLAPLLARLQDPTEGTITWDGTDLRRVDREALRTQIGVLSQDSFVLRATIYDNLCLGRPEATEAEVLAAARVAGLHEHVEGLPGGYDTVVSDRDPLLTPPIRQQLAVAQVLLREPSVIVLEDATAALEPAAQRRIEAALRGPDGRRTLILVTQRVSTAADADRIYVLDGGRVVECGTHDELLDRGGLYQQLLRDEVGDAAIGGARQAARGLSKLALFSGLPKEILDEVARLLLPMPRAAGQEIVRQGSVGDELFIVARGEVEVVVQDETGEEHVLNVLGEGDYFGEISFLRRAARTATVRARTAAELYLLRRLDFDRLLERLDGAMLHQMEETARSRIEDTRARLAALSASSG